MVVILDSDQEALDNAQSQLPLLAGGICADVSSPDEIEAAFKEEDRKERAKRFREGNPQEQSGEESGHP